jgi:hypothetical protein
MRRPQNWGRYVVNNSQQCPNPSPIHTPALFALDLTCRDEFQAEVEKSSTPFSMRDLERLKDDLDDLTRYSETYFEEREVLMNELEEVISDLLSYGSPPHGAG